MGIRSEDAVKEDHYYCEKCRPDMHTELLKYARAHFLLYAHQQSPHTQETRQATSGPSLILQLPSRLSLRQPELSFSLPVSPEAPETPEYYEQP
jgi:hypothetical protein